MDEILPPLTTVSEREDFSAFAIQELGSLLGTLQGELKYALVQPESQAQTIRQAIEISEKILLITRNIKLFSLHNPVVHSPKDVSQILLDSMDHVEKELLKNGTHLTVLAEAGVSLNANPDVLFTVFSNLALFISNLTHSKNELNVSLKHSQKEIVVEFHLQDVALAEPILSHLGNPFALRDLAPQLSFLSLVYGSSKCAVENLGGTLKVLSSKTGTQYLITFPFDESHSKALSFPQKRKAKRVRTHLLCQAQLTPTLQSEGVISIISTHGAYIKLLKNDETYSPELHANLSLEIALVGHKDIKINQAKIANLSQSTSHWGIGIEFLEVEPKGKIILQELIRCNID